MIECRVEAYTCGRMECLSQKHSRLSFCSFLIAPLVVALKLMVEFPIQSNHQSHYQSSSLRSFLVRSEAQSSLGALLGVQGQSRDLTPTHQIFAVCEWDSRWRSNESEARKYENIISMRFLILIPSCIMEQGKHVWRSWHAPLA